MRVGFDVDGVLASFYEAYEHLCVTVDGRNLFPPLDREQGPPVWDWPEYYGYSDRTMKKVWQLIEADTSFWRRLPELDNAWFLRNAWHNIADVHDIYFVTDRVGPTAKLQTEEWLTDALWAKYERTPTVLIAKDKAAIARALELDIYVDDRPSNIEAVAAVDGHSVPPIEVYIQDRAYNRHCTRGTLIPTIQPILDRLVT